ncbi:hypothetical protein RFI_20309, partial [Reticulomyxa filosa]
MYTLTCNKLFCSVPKRKKKKRTKKKKKSYLKVQTLHADISQSMSKTVYSSPTIVPQSETSVAVDPKTDSPRNTSGGKGQNKRNRSATNADDIQEAKNMKDRGRGRVERNSLTKKTDNKKKVLSPLSLNDRKARSRSNTLKEEKRSMTPTTGTAVTLPPLQSNTTTYQWVDPKTGKEMEKIVTKIISFDDSMATTSLDNVTVTTTSSSSSSSSSSKGAFQ